ncbi:MAG: hypothetical protein KF893_25930 [Caldilineaceae bacterium]|nr:hypothetical protein [Caldilineaceae bacterium]
MASSREYTVLKQIFVWLATEQRRWQESVLSTTSRRDLFEQVEIDYPSIEERELENYLNSSDTIELLKWGKFLYLRPIEEGGFFIPVLTIKYDFGGHEQEIRLRLAFFCIDENGDIKASGFRFEAPEDTDGLHNYFHVQAITGFDKDTPKYQLPCEKWIPVKQPALCFDANGPVSLVVGMLVSLYGFNYIKELMNKGFGSELTPFIKDTGWFQRNHQGATKRRR